MRLVFEKIFTCFVVAACIAGMATAQTFVAAPNISFVLDFDTDDGAYSSWRADDLSGLNAMEARVTFLRKGKHKKWVPSFSISLADEADRATLSVTALPKSGPLVMRTETSSERGDDPFPVYALPPEFGEEFDLLVEWNDQGLVVFTVYSKAAETMNGYERHEVQLDHAPNKLRISVSTGEVMFDPLRLGRMENAETE